MTNTNGKKAASVTFSNVTKIYGKDVRAVNDISLEISPGMLVTLLGPSGCGKTTTLRMIAGLEMATSGRIFINDKDVTRLPATDRDVSMVFQSYALFPHMNVMENVSYGLKYSGFNKVEARERAFAGLDIVGLRDLADRLPSELSGGQQQRAAVARALVLEPQVLLFDEPLSNLDAKLRRQVREEIREIQQSLGLTVVYVTHDQEEALAVSDRVIVMRNAEIAQEGTPHDLYEQPTDVFVADFVGDANLLKCEIARLDGADAIVRLGDLELQLPHRDLSVGEADIAIRPEAVRLNAERATDAIAGEVRKAVYLGSHVEYMVDTAIGELFVIDPRADHAIVAGSSVMVTLAQRGVVLVRP